MTAETAKLSLRVESTGATRATQELDNLTQTSEKVERSAKRAENSVKGLGNEAAKSGGRIGQFTGQIGNATSALDQINNHFSESRQSLMQFLAAQVQAGRSIDDNGNIITAYGVKAQGLTEEYKKLQREFVNATNNTDRLADAMNTASLATDKNQAATAAAALRQQQLEDAANDVKQAIDRQRQSVQSTVASYAKFDKAANDSSRNTGRVGQRAAQASIQVEQLVNSIAAGANPTQAFAFQAADLGIVLGLPLLGSIIGVSAALAGPFISSLFESEDATEELANTLALLDRVATQQNGILAFTDDLRELAAVSEDAAKLRVEAAIIAARDGVSQAGSAITEELENSLNLDGWLASLSRSVDSALANSFSGAPTLSVGVGFNYNNDVADALGESFGFVGDEARAAGKEVIEMIASVRQFRTPESITTLEEKLTELAQSSDVNREKLILMVNSLSDFFDQGRQAGEAADELGESLERINSGDTDITADTAQLQSARELTQKLAGDIAIAEQRLAGADENAMRLQYAISQGYATFEQMPEPAQALINRLIEVNQLQEDSNEKAKERQDAARLEEQHQQAIENLSQSLNGQILALEQGAQAAYEFGISQQLGLDATEALPAAIQAQIDKLYELKDAQSQERENDNLVQKAISRYDQIHQANLRYKGMEEELENERYNNLVKSMEEEIQLIEEKGALTQEIEDRYREAREEAEQNHRENLSEINEGYWERFQEHVANTADNFDSMWGNTFDRFSSGIAEATTTALFEQQSFGDAMKEITRGAIQSVIQGLIEIGIQKLTLFALEKTIATTSAATSAATASATGTAIATAYAPAAAMASLASYGANSIPAMGGIAATVGLSSSLALAGMAHDGIDDVPREGTWLLDKGERVVDSRTNKDLKNYLNSSNQQASNVSINAPITLGGDVSDEKILRTIERNPKRIARIINRLNGVPA